MVMPETCGFVEQRREIERMERRRKQLGIGEVNMATINEFERSNCPKCHSPNPRLHPALQHEGEVSLCRDPWHVPTAEQIEATDTLTRENERLTADNKFLHQRRGELVIERDHALHDYDQARERSFKLASQVGEMTGTIERLTRELAAKDEALKFYADPDTYNKDLNGPNDPFVCALDRDEGSLARAALKGVKSDEQG